MTLNQFVKQIAEIYRENRRSLPEYYALGRELSELTPREMKTLITEVLEDTFIKDIEVSWNESKLIISKLTGTPFKEVKMEEKLIKSYTKVDGCKIELQKALENDQYLTTFPFAVMDLYLESISLGMKIYDVFKEFNPDYKDFSVTED